MSENDAEKLKIILFGNNEVSIKFSLEEVLITRLSETGIFFIQDDEMRNISLCVTFLFCVRYVLKGEIFNNLLFSFSKSREN